MAPFLLWHGSYLMQKFAISQKKITITECCAPNTSRSTVRLLFVGMLFVSHFQAGFFKSYQVEKDLISKIGLQLFNRKLVI
jgi:hypothetical protein